MFMAPRDSDRRGAAVPTREVQTILESARPYFGLAGWILQRIGDLHAGDAATVDEGKRQLQQLGDSGLTALVDEDPDWLRIADVLLADSIRILQEETARPHLDVDARDSISRV